MESSNVTPTSAALQGKADEYRPNICCSVKEEVIKYVLIKNLTCLVNKHENKKVKRSVILQ